MSNSDFSGESERDPDAPVIRPEPPRIVNLPTSFDMSEFFSEAVELQPFKSEKQPMEAAVASDRTPDPEPLQAEAEAPEPPSVPVATASVLEFPAHGSESAHGRAAPPPGDGVVTLVDILENQGGMTWREAVALVHQLCLRLKEHSPHVPILLDPRNILISHTGDVELLPGQIGGDPLVMQLGRLLQTMLRGKAAPPELRLLVAQATFELPIFETIDDIDRALVKIERLDENDGEEADRYAPTAALQVATSRVGAEDSTTQSRPIRPPAQPRRLRRRVAPLAMMLSSNSARIVAGALIAIAVALLLVNPPVYIWQNPPSQITSTQGTFGSGTPGASEAAQPAAPGSQALRPEAATPETPTVQPNATLATSAPSAASRAPDRNSVVIQSRHDRPTRTTRGAETATPPPTVTPRESERRASALVAQGQTAQAAMVFDSLLMANPLYEPKATDLTPESMAAFRASQRVLLPVLAVRGYDRAKAALSAGDVDRALATIKETAAILERPATNATSEQKLRLQELNDQATLAKATAEEVIYTAADPGVIPPRPISRQFPAATPNGVPPHRIGTLEMIIGKDGSVEFVKLHTPLNRYHERMIVSAAKAWQYHPAMRFGKAVKYRLTVQINLPENGTY
jgi:hypothetical protein